MIDLYGRQAQREGTEAIRRSLLNPLAGTVEDQLAKPAGAVLPGGETPGTVVAAGTGTGTPLIDTSNAIGSLAELLGPTPAEREARQRRMEQNKQSMSAWLGLFDGLRQLGNLYYATKGATPQTYNNPYQLVDNEIQQQRQLYDNSVNYRRQYATSLYNLQRQLEADKMAREKHDANLKWLDTKDEMARQKAELDKLKSVKVIKQKDGSLIKYDPVSGATEPLSEADPLYVEYMQSRINQTNKRTGLIGAPVTTTKTNAKGETSTSVRSYGSGGGGSSNKYVKYRRSSGGQSDKDKYAKYKTN